MGFLRNWLSGRSSAPATGSEAIADLANGLDGLPPDRARFIAGFALLLSRIAASDHDVTAEEAHALTRFVHEKGGLPMDQAAAVVERAQAHQRHSGGTDDFLVTRDLAQTMSYDQKLAVIDCLFAVAAADDRIRALESNEIGRIAKELRVEQHDLSRIRHQYRDFLAARAGLE